MKNYFFYLFIYCFCFLFIYHYRRRKTPYENTWNSSSLFVALLYYSWKNKWEIYEDTVKKIYTHTYIYSLSKESLLLILILRIKDPIMISIHISNRFWSNRFPKIGKPFVFSTALEFYISDSWMVWSVASRSKF